MYSGIMIKEVTDDSYMVNSARTTVGKEHIEIVECSKDFAIRMYLAEHSPIRTKMYNIVIEGVPYWLSTHFVRHNVGVTPFVSTQRDDRNPEVKNRDDRRQGALVTLEFFLNAQAIINISKDRLCSQAHVKATYVWKNVIRILKELNPELARACVPKCIYRGWCYEMNSCEYHLSSAFQHELKLYRKGINDEPKEKSKKRE